MPASNALSAAWLAYAFQGTYSANLYVGLSTAHTNAAYTEVPNGFAYARVSKTANATNFPITGRVVSNGTQIAFPSPTGSWGTPLYAFLANTATWGSAISTIVAWAAIPTPVVISSGQLPSFDVGQLSFTES